METYPLWQPEASWRSWKPFLFCLFLFDVNILIFLYFFFFVLFWLYSSNNSCCPSGNLSASSEESRISCFQCCMQIWYQEVRQELWNCHAFSIVTKLCDLVPDTTALYSSRVQKAWGGTFALVLWLYPAALLRQQDCHCIKVFIALRNVFCGFVLSTGTLFWKFFYFLSVFCSYLQNVSTLRLWGLLWHSFGPCRVIFYLLNLKQIKGHLEETMVGEVAV